MSIELVKKGMCKDCPFTKTSNEIIRSFTGSIEFVNCEHEQACKRAWELGYEEGVEDMNK